MRFGAGVASVARDERDRDYAGDPRVHHDDRSLDGGTTGVAQVVLTALKPLERRFAPGPARVQVRPPAVPRGLRSSVCRGPGLGRCPACVVLVQGVSLDVTSRAG